MIFDYENLLNAIQKHYETGNENQKIDRFCKQIQIKQYRFKRIVNNVPKCYFNSDEIMRMSIELNIAVEDFFKIKEA